MSVTASPFGALKDGTMVTSYRLENASGCAAVVIDYGAAIQSLIVPDRNGNPVDVLLGYDTPEEYASWGGHLGGTIGRVGNRIGGASFSLNGKTYQLAQNNGKNHLHGGLRGFDKYLWEAKPGENCVAFTRLSPDGEEGYPGNLTMTVTFTLTEDNALHILYEAVCDADTLVNPTNHAYFNLNGGGSALDHQVQIFAERFCEIDEGGLPTGEILSVAGTPFDFRQPKALGADIDAADDQIRRGNGYDHNFVLSGRKAAVVYSEQTGIRMITETDMPGMQLYSANGLKPRTLKGGKSTGPRESLCLETQLHPNGMECYGFPSPVLRKGRRLHTETVYRFER